MKRRFEVMVILLLTCAFMSCPAFIGRASAEEGTSSRSIGEMPLARAVLQAMGKAGALPDFETEFPTTITELIELVSNSEMVQQIKGVHDERVQTRTERVNKIKELFGGGIPASGN